MSWLTMGALGAETVVEDPLARASRLCSEALKRGEGASSAWCQERDRLRAARPAVPGPRSTTTAAEAGLRRDLQAEAERRAIASRLLVAGVNPAIASAAATGRDVDYADMDLTQYAVAQAALSNQQAVQLSAQAQADKIRNQWRVNAPPAPSYPQPIPERAQDQIILGVQARQGAMGMGAKVALGVLAAVAVFSLGALMPGGKR